MTANSKHRGRHCRSTLVGLGTGTRLLGRGVTPALWAAWLFLCLGTHGVIAQTGGGAEALRFSSGAEPVALIELFTSEGCSSCPPADRWLSSLKDDPGLWTDFVPVAFHVDYWDAIGWPDRFADPRFGQRQRRYYAEGVVRGVYTPGVIAGGQEWRSWRRRGAVPAAAGAGGLLTASLDGGELRVRYAAPENELKDSDYQVHVAWLAMDQLSEVRAGENRGKQLINDFVVLDTTDLPLEAADGVTEARFSARISAASEAMALAVWVSPVGEQAPLQATGGWLRRDRSPSP